MKTIGAMRALVVGATLASTSLAAAQPLPPTTMDDVVILANTTLTFERNSKLGSGQAVVNAPGGVARLTDRFVVLAGTALLVADVIEPVRILTDPPVVIDVVANSIDPGIKVTGATAGATFPIFAPFPSATSVNPGSTDVVVTRGNSPLYLDPGSYRKIRVAPEGVVYFTGGRYDVREIRATRRSSLLFLSPVTVNVAERFSVGRNVRFMPAGPSLPARCVVINVGTNAHRAGTLATNGKLFATINAPASKLRLGSFGEFQGQFVGNTVSVGVLATVWADTPCP